MRQSGSMNSMERGSSTRKELAIGPSHRRFVSCDARSWNFQLLSRGTARDDRHGGLGILFGPSPRKVSTVAIAARPAKREFVQQHDSSKRNLNIIRARARETSSRRSDQGLSSPLTWSAISSTRDSKKEGRVPCEIIVWPLEARGTPDKRNGKDASA